MDFSQMQMGPKLTACTERERLFVWYLLTTADGNASEAARQAGYSNVKDGAKVQAHHLMHRPRVIEAIEEVGRKEFRTLLVPAIQAMRKLIRNPDHPDHAKTVATLLSRLGFGEKTALDVTVTGQIELNHTDAAVEDLRIMLEMGVPEERLVECFGYSGLPRYKRMLAERESKSKLIEGKADIESEPTSIG
jgi:hypothetical protein